ncbi:microsomal glutathione S-transferase 2-like [Littorina saxatilis]|uniref:Microsomal glutathione S-transferase 2 n=1 Tax=Littorina saxatilis TaxID=31220 RepID=A0AAN9B315_9CAEN
MTAIELEDIIYTSIVTLLAGIQLVFFARMVGKSRMKHKVPYPQMTGDANFERALRAQQNSLEFFPVFLITLWLSSLFFNQVASAVVGLVYLYSRQKYVSGYCRDVKDRIPGFKLGVRCLMFMAGLAMCGFVTVLLRSYTDIDLAVMLRNTIKK